VFKRRTVFGGGREVGVGVKDEEVKVAMVEGGQAGQALKSSCRADLQARHALICVARPTKLVTKISLDSSSLPTTLTTLREHRRCLLGGWQGPFQVEERHFIPELTMLD